MREVSVTRFTGRLVVIWSATTLLLQAKTSFCTPKEPNVRDEPERYEKNKKCSEGLQTCIYQYLMERMESQNFPPQDRLRKKKGGERS